MGFTRYGESPVRVLPIKVTVRVDHLRLHPDAEPHSHRVNFSAETVQAVRQLFPVFRPVPQGTGVVIPVSKPAVIQNKQLDSHIPGSSCQAEKSALVEPEIRRLPAVQEHRPRLALPFSSHNMAAHKGMHLQTESGPPLRGKRKHCLRRVKGFSRMEQPGEASGMNAAENPGLSVCIDLRRLIMIPAVNQVHADAGAILLSCFRPAEQNEGIGPVGGRTGSRGHRTAPRCDSPVRPVHLPRPGSREGSHPQAAFRKIQLRAQQSFQSHRFPAGVNQAAAPADHILLLINIVVQLQEKLVLPVPQRHAEMVSFFYPVRGWQFPAAFLFLRNFRVVKQKIRRPASVRVNNLHERFPDISLSPRGHLQTGILQEKRLLILAVADHVSGLAPPLF